jgi:hypothetical protein
MEIKNIEPLFKKYDIITKITDWNTNTTNITTLIIEPRIIWDFNNNKYDNIFSSINFDLNINLINDNKSLKNLFSTQMFNSIYIKLINNHFKTFLEYCFLNNIQKNLSDEELQNFYYLSNKIPGYNFGVWLKNIIKNSINDYNNIVDYSEQSNKLSKAVIEIYNNNYNKLFKLSANFILNILQVVNDMSDNEIESLLNTNIDEINKIFIKNNIENKALNWNI